MNKGGCGIPFERFWACVLDHPKGLTEEPSAYIRRIAELAAGAHLGAPAKPFTEVPEQRLPYADR